MSFFSLSFSLLFIFTIILSSFSFCAEEIAYNNGTYSDNENVLTLLLSLSHHQLINKVYDHKNSSSEMTIYREKIERQVSASVLSDSNEDDIACTRKCKEIAVTDYCDPATGWCHHEPNPCTDEDVCHERECIHIPWRVEEEEEEEEEVFESKVEPENEKFTPLTFFGALAIFIIMICFIKGNYGVDIVDAKSFITNKLDSQKYNRNQKHRRKREKINITGNDIITNKKENECVICFVNEKCIAFGCGHVIGCVNCSRILVKGEAPSCPVCKKSIITAFRVYL